MYCIFKVSFLKISILSAFVLLSSQRTLSYIWIILSFYFNGITNAFVPLPTISLFMFLLFSHFLLFDATWHICPMEQTAALTAPGSSLEMQILGSHPTDHILHFNSTPRDLNER